MSAALTTDRLTLRPPTPADEGAFVAYYDSDFRAQHGYPLNADQARAKFARVLQHWQEKGFGRFIVTARDSDDPMGLIGPHRPDDYPEPELAWHLWSADHLGKGLGFEAARAARAHARDALGWTGAVSYIRAENAPSIRLAERLGAVADPAAPYPASIGPHVPYRHDLTGGPAR